MNNKFLFKIISLVFLTAGCAGNKEGAKTEFWVRGNCEMCEERIEGTLNKLPGVNDADWDVDSKIATVYFDSTKVSTEELNQAVANVGHETRNVRADSIAYLHLHKCCKKPEDM